MSKSKKKISSPRGDGMSSNRSGVDMRHPPKRRIPGPIIDSHTHITTPKNAALFVEAARVYQIDKVFGITNFKDAEALRKRYGTFFEFWHRPTYEDKDKPKLFKRVQLDLLDEAFERGYKGVKFWFKPPFNIDQKMRFDDPRLYPIFERMGELGLPGLVHIADPDVWFERVYNDQKKFGTKRENYDQLKNMLRDFPNVTIQGAHFAGDPEHLDHLQEMMDQFPNLLLDCSGTKWIVREMSKQRNAAREFIIRYADRILFGSDLVTFDGITEFDRYASRYWVHQMLWETGVKCQSPIDDPDSTGIPRLNGLDLPDEVLEKLYWRNAVRVFDIRKPRVRSAMPGA